MADESRGMSIDKSKTSHYQKSKVEVDGKQKRVYDNGDEVAEMLRGKTSEDDLRSVARDHGLEDRFDGWSHLNSGQRRMNLGNALRHKFRKERVATQGSEQAAE